VLRERQWRSWGARDWAMAVAAGALAIAALVPFALLQPALRALGTSNVIALSVVPALRPQTLAFTAVAVLAAAFLWRAGAILELMLLAWVMLMLFSLHQAEQWHSLVLLAWLCAPIFGHWRHAPGRDVVPMALQVRLWFVLCVAAMVFHESPLPTWIARLF